VSTTRSPPGATIVTGRRRRLWGSPRSSSRELQPPGVRGDTE
jgi:hypothetical protein